MRSARFAFVFYLFLCAVPVWAQQTSTQPTPSPAPKDPQAVSIVNQTLAAVGGISAILNVTDYTASGTIIYHQDQDVQGSVKVSGLGLTEFREDSTLPTGVRSFSLDSNGAVLTKNENGMIRNLNYKYQAPLMKSSVVIPCWQLAAALNDPLFAVSYKGTTQVDGNTVYDIRIQFTPPEPPDPNGVIAEYFGADFFIDPTTFQVRMTQDVVGRHSERKVRYDNYKPVNGVLIPLSIDEEIDGQRIRTIQLNQIALNTGLQDSDFDL
jgi:hypothetical protein